MSVVSTAKTVSDLPERFNAAVDLIYSNLTAGRGDKTAVIDAGGEHSYSDLARGIDEIAGVAAKLGLKRGDRVLMCLLDTVDFPIVFLGCIKAGIVPVPLNTLLVEEDYRWLLEDSGAAAVIVADELSEKWRGIATDRPGVAFVSVNSGPWPSLRELRAVTPGSAGADTRRDEVAFWLYTSGSTGRPKGAMHAHTSMRLTANLYGSGVVGYCEDDIVLSVAKQFFAYGLGNSISFPFAVGATTVLLKDRSTPEAVSRLMRRHKVSILNAVPTFLAGWLASDGVPAKSDVPAFRLATSAGESLPGHLGEKFRDRFAIDVLDGLGSTEMLHIFLTQRPGTVRYGATGKPAPGYDVRLVDDDGGVIHDADSVGELQVRGPTAALGYWRNPEKTKALRDGEWVRTGDKYECDHAGWYCYAGRSDDMLKVGGIYVSPIEVEDALTAHNAVLEAAVVGAADGAGLIKPRAFVVVKDHVTANDDLKNDLKAFVKSRLAPYKYPRSICFVPALPKTASGKIQRFKLRETS